MQKAITGAFWGAPIGAMANLLAKVPWRWGNTPIVERGKIVFKSIFSVTTLATTLTGAFVGSLIGRNQEARESAMQLENNRLETENTALRTDKQFTRQILQEQIDKLKQAESVNR